LETSGEHVEKLHDLVDLNPFAVQYRYETLEGEDEPIDRNQVLSRVEEVFEFVKGVISP
jgi:hypothetical protein